MKRSVYIVYSDNMFNKMFISHGWDIVNNLAEADLVQFTGGEDVSPHLYGESLHPATAHNPQRDAAERTIYNRAQEMGIPCAGVCRGGQFLNVMNNGKMWQDVNNHNHGSHLASIVGGLVLVMVTSTHHQMMRPSDDGMILMTAGLSTRKERKEGANIHRRVIENPKDVCEDVEAVYYPLTNTLCYQPHPEYRENECTTVYFNFIEEYLFGDAGQDKPLEVINGENSTLVM